jgi:pyruvate dehydrogenase E1 component beta subunit
LATITYRQALHDTLRAELLRDEDVFLMGEEIGVFEGSYKITAGLLKEFGPRRVRDTPIAEEGFVGMAFGAAMLGLRPVVEIMTINFSVLAMDQILNHGAKIYAMFGGQTPVPMVLRTPGGGGQQLAATHSQNLEVWFAHIPGLKVVAPSTPADAKGLLTTSIRDDDPVIFIEGEMLYNTKGDVPEGEHIVPLGQADVKREGGDVTLVCHSKSVAVSLKAAEQLAKEGVNAEVVDLRTIRPLDTEAVLNSVAKTHRCVVVEEGWPFAGVGAQVVDTIQREVFDELDAPVLRVTGADVPMPYNKQLEKAAKADPAKVVQAVNQVLYRE